MIRNVAQCSTVRATMSKSGVRTSLTTDMLSNNNNNLTIIRSNSIQTNQQRSLSFYTPYQDDVSVTTKPTVTPKPTPTPSSTGTSFQDFQNQFPNEGEFHPQSNPLNDTGFSQQMIFLGSQQASTEAVAYLFSQQFGSTPVRQLSHASANSILDDMSQGKNFILWSDTPDILTNSPFAGILPNPLFITVYLDFPPSQLPPMKELTLDHKMSENKTKEEMFMQNVRRDPNDPITSGEAHMHDSAFMFDDQFDYRIYVSPEDTPNQVYDRIQSRMMQSEAHISTRGVYTSEKNMITQTKMQQEPDKEPDIVAFPQTLENIMDRRGGSFVPDMPSPYLLDKANMFNVNESGKVEYVDNKTAMRELMEKVQRHEEQNMEEEDSANHLDFDQPPADFGGSVIEMAFLPQILSRMVDFTFEQKLQRVLEACPVGNIHAKKISDNLAKAFFLWDNPAVAGVVPFTTNVTAKPKFDYKNTHCLELFNGPTGSHQDIVQTVSCAMLQAALEHNNYLSQMNDYPINSHKANGYVSGGNFDNFLACLAHLPSDQPYASLHPASTTTRATPHGYLLSEQSKTDMRSLEKPSIDIALMHSLANKRSVPPMIAGVRMADSTNSLSSTNLTEMVSREFIVSEHNREILFNKVGSWTTTTPDDYLPVQVYPMVASILHGYLELVRKESIVLPPVFDTVAQKKFFQKSFAKIMDTEDSDREESPINTESHTDTDVTPEDISEMELSLQKLNEKRKQSNIKKIYTIPDAIVELSQQPPEERPSIDEMLYYTTPRTVPANSNASSSHWDWPLFNIPTDKINSIVNINDLVGSIRPTVMDITTNSDQLDIIFAALSARDMGVPIRQVNVAANPDNVIINDLLSEGIIRAPCVPSHSRVISDATISLVERIFHTLSGRNVKECSELGLALQSHMDYSLLSAQNSMIGPGYNNKLFHDALASYGLRFPKRPVATTKSKTKKSKKTDTKASTETTQDGTVENATEEGLDLEDLSPTEQYRKLVYDFFFENTDFVKSLLDQTGHSHLSIEKEYISAMEALADFDSTESKTRYADSEIIFKLSDSTLANLRRFINVETVSPTVLSKTITAHLENTGRLVSTDDAPTVSILSPSLNQFNVSNILEVLKPYCSNLNEGKPLNKGPEAKLNTHVISKNAVVHIPNLVVQTKHYERTANELAYHFKLKKAPRGHSIPRAATISQKFTGLDIVEDAVNDINRVNEVAKDILNNSLNCVTGDLNSLKGKRLHPSPHPTLVEDISNAPITNRGIIDIPLLAEDKGVLHYTIIQYFLNHSGGASMGQLPDQIIKTLRSRAEDTLNDVTHDIMLKWLSNKFKKIVGSKKQ